VSCRKTADSIDIRFGMKTCMARWEPHMLGGSMVPFGGRGNFGGCFSHSNAL